MPAPKLATLPDLTPPRRRPNTSPPDGATSTRAAHHAYRALESMDVSSNDYRVLAALALGITYTAPALDPAPIARATLLTATDDYGTIERVHAHDVRADEEEAPGEFPASLRAAVDRAMLRAGRTAAEDRMSLVGPVRVEYQIDRGVDFHRPRPDRRLWEPVTTRLPDDAWIVEVVVKIPARPLFIGNLPSRPTEP
ncbi:hypothetical protein ACFCZ3_19970 [Cellulosimicrobium cellulans]|uniref:hypothetical protein n=1 Tax=Cellulosimicrobium cellulans TaxID=1710 RepID=UPI0035DF83FA